jgi:hypothetical protein
MEWEIALPLRFKRLGRLFMQTKGRRVANLSRTARIFPVGTLLQLVWISKICQVKAGKGVKPFSFVLFDCG